jgi:hypothetical protein
MSITYHIIDHYSNACLRHTLILNYTPKDLYHNEGHFYPFYHD